MSDQPSARKNAVEPSRGKPAKSPTFAPGGLGTNWLVPTDPHSGKMPPKGSKLRYVDVELVICGHCRHAVEQPKPVCNRCTGDELRCYRSVAISPTERHRNTICKCGAKFIIRIRSIARKVTS